MGTIFARPIATPPGTPHGPEATSIAVKSGTPGPWSSSTKVQLVGAIHPALAQIHSRRQQSQQSSSGALRVWSSNTRHRSNSSPEPSGDLTITVVRNTLIRFRDSERWGRRLRPATRLPLSLATAGASFLGLGGGPDATAMRDGGTLCRPSKRSRRAGRQLQTGCVQQRPWTSRSLRPPGIPRMVAAGGSSLGAPPRCVGALRLSVQGA